MKLFTSDNVGQYSNSNRDFQWTENGEILRFSLFPHPETNFMIGLTSNKGTTNIVVKDIDITKELLIELFTDYLKDTYTYGNKFTSDEIRENKSIPEVDELILKASQFNEGDHVQCNGKELSKI